MDEVADQARAVGCVDHFRMELHAVEAAGFVRRDREGRAFAGGDHGKAGGQRIDLVAMAHPYLVPLARGPESLEKQRGALHLDEGTAEFAALAGGDHGAAELRAHGLLAVADAENGDARREDLLRHARALLEGDRCGPAGQDHAVGAQPVESLGGGVERGDLGIDPRLAHPAGDELSDLAAEIDDQDGLRMGRISHAAGR